MRVRVTGQGVLLFLCTLSLFNLPGIAESVSDPTSKVPLAPGYGKLNYKLPSVGSYQLPVLGKAADGQVLDEQGNSLPLHDLLADKYTLLSFIYSNCTDINGCPLTANVFYKLKTAMREDVVLADNLRLLTVSFDPARDTPEVMRLYGANFKYAGNKGEWRFLTTASMDELNPILEAYHQDIQRNLSVNGSLNGDISHILRVFLIDPVFNIRNIYSVSFLHADLIANDLKTLISNSSFSVTQLPTTFTSSTKKEAETDPVPVPLLSKPGDNKKGYQNSSYTTDSKALIQRQGKGQSADLLAIAKQSVLGLPKLSDVVINSLSTEKIALGRKLFFDRRLSLNNTFSCAMCHVPEQGFTSNEVSMAVGIEGRSVRRNTPTLYNVAYTTRLFHDGRERSLEQQVWGPLLAKNEMGNPSVGTVIDKISWLKGYKDAFTRVFEQQGINMLTVGKALAAYQRTLISANSPFDQWYFGHQEQAISLGAKKGFEVFTGKGKCSSCHVVNKKHALFTDNLLHNTGIGYENSMGIKPEKERIVLAPGIFVDIDQSAIDSVGEPEPADLGLYEITENPADRWKYKTPTLRNISLTAPYMHNGSLGSLREVVEFYNKGGIKNEVLDSLIKPLDLSPEEVANLVSFLKTLTGSNVDLLVADAFAAPVGDVK